MPQSVGWIKLHRDLRYKFSHDRKLNFELWNLYVFLIEQTPWEDTRENKKGQLRMTAVDIQSQWFTNMYVKKIRRLLKKLHDDGYIKLSMYSKVNRDGFLIEICQYDSIFSENNEKKCPTTVPQVSQECPTTVPSKESISLSNKEIKNHDCPTTVPQVSQECPTKKSIYIEERIKKEEERKKEELEFNSLQNFSDEKCLLPVPIINNDLSVKVKKKKSDLDHQEALDTFYREYEKRYQVKPLINGVVIRHIKNLVKRCEKDAPRLISFYLSHNNAFYLSKAHQIEYALKDCEKLHTEMLKNDYIFHKDTKKVEESTSNSLLLDKLLTRYRKEEK